MSFLPFLLAVPALAACACVWARRWAPRLSVVSALVTLALAGALAAEGFSAPAQRALGGAISLDALSALIVLIVALVAALATIPSVASLPNQVDGDRHRPLPLPRLCARSPPPVPAFFLSRPPRALFATAGSFRSLNAKRHGSPSASAWTANASTSTTSTGCRESDSRQFHVCPFQD